jgi:hypothetical protein
LRVVAGGQSGSIRRVTRRAALGVVVTTGSNSLGHRAICWGSKLPKSRAVVDALLALRTP